MSSATGADARGHLRGESVAVPRRAGTTQTRGGGLGGTSPSGRRGSPGDALSFLDSQRRKRTVVKVVLGGVALLVLLQLVRPSFSQRSVNAVAHARKAALVGGESWVLPKRYLETDTHELGECKRVLLYTFSSFRDDMFRPISLTVTEKCFASRELELGAELELYLRASVIAQKLGYTVLADDQHWTYGSVRDYFLPRQIYCRPPVDWFLQTAAVPLGSKRWVTKDRVWLSQANLDAADEWLRSEVLDVNALEELRRTPSSGLLKEGYTLAPALEEVFADFAGAARDLLGRPNDQLATLIRSLRMELGLGEGGLRSRKHSPTWGGNKREGSGESRQAVEDVAEDEHDFEEAGGAQRSDRGPVIGAQLGKGPSTSAALLGASPSAVGDYSLVIEAANEATQRLSKSTIAEPGFSRSRPVIFRGLTPTLLCFTPDDSAFEALTAPQVAKDLIIGRTPAPSVEALRPWNELLGGRQSLTWLYEPAKFATLPRPLRVLLTRHQIRDLITLSTFADAFIVAGSSSLGRLALLTGGLDAVVGPRDFFTGHGLGGRVRSFDVPWYPTSSPEALFASP